MKAIKLNLALLITALLMACVLPLQAQQNESPDDENKIVIIKKYTDEDGVEVVEKTVKDGDDVNLIISDDMDIDMDMNINVDVEVDDENGEERKIIRIRTTDENGEEQIFEWNGEGEMPAEMKEKMKAMKGKVRMNRIHHDNDRAMRWHHGGSDGNKAFLGVVMGKTVTNEDGEETVEGVSEQGVPIMKVVEGSAAQAAGLLVNDIITAIDDTQTRSIEDVTKAIGAKKPGDAINISYLRNNQTVSTTATLKAKERKKRHYRVHKKGPHHFNSWAYEDRPCVFIGVYVNNSSDLENQKGAHVNGIIDNTPAHEAGMQKGDVITALNGVSVSNYNELLDERNKYKPGDQVSLSYLRSGESLMVDITFPDCDKKSKSWNDDQGNHFFFDTDNFVFEGQDGQKIKRNKVIIIKKKKMEKAEKSEEGSSEEDIIIDEPIEIASPALQLNDFRAFPNPTSGQVNISFKGEAVPTTISVVDVTGREIFRQELTDFDGSYNQQINVGDAPNGTLLLNVQQGEQVYTQKIILNRA